MDDYRPSSNILQYRIDVDILIIVAKNRGFQFRKPRFFVF